MVVEPYSPSSVTRRIKVYGCCRLATGVRRGSSGATRIRYWDERHLPMFLHPHPNVAVTVFKQRAWLKCIM